MEREEALNAIRKYKGNWIYEVQEAIETLIPELRESEDERIRSMYSEYLYDSLRTSMEQFMDRFESTITWFERQKEQKSEWNEEDETNRDFILELLEDQVRFCKKNAEGAYYANQIRTAQNWLNALPLRIKKNNEDTAKLCSNEWTDEDEMLLNHLITFVEKYGLQFYASTDKVIDQLKSRRPQPKDECGKVEKATIDYADEFPGMTHENDGSTIEDYDKPYNDFLAGVLWAKHHGVFQNGNTHWKASEEQMEAVDRCVDYLEESDNEDAEIMESFQEQLNQLKQ